MQPQTPYKIGRGNVFGTANSSEPFTLKAIILNVSLNISTTK